MVDVARVNLFGQPIATFRWDELYGVAQMEYDKGFIGQGIEPSPLMMPVREGRVYSFASLNRETSYNPNGGWTAMHQMSIGGKFDEITKEDLLAFAKKNNIKDASAVIKEVSETASRWPSLARECGVPTAMIDKIMQNLCIDYRTT